MDETYTNLIHVEPKIQSRNLVMPAELVPVKTGSGRPQNLYIETHPTELMQHLRDAICLVEVMNCYSMKTKWQESSLLPYT